jgi:hypothetical protein
MARSRWLQKADEVREANRRSRLRAIRCVECGRVVKEGDLVLVRPLRAPAGRALPCHLACADEHGRTIMSTLKTMPA